MPSFLGELHLLDHQIEIFTEIADPYLPGLRIMLFTELTHPSLPPPGGGVCPRPEILCAARLKVFVHQDLTQRLGGYVFSGPFGMIPPLGNCAAIRVPLGNRLGGGHSANSRKSGPAGGLSLGGSVLSNENSHSDSLTSLIARVACQSGTPACTRGYYGKLVYTLPREGDPMATFIGKACGVRHGPFGPDRLFSNRRPRRPPVFS